MSVKPTSTDASSQSTPIVNQPTDTASTVSAKVTNGSGSVSRSNSNVSFGTSTLNNAPSTTPSIFDLFQTHQATATTGSNSNTSSTASTSTRQPSVTVGRSQGRAISGAERAIPGTDNVSSATSFVKARRDSLMGSLKDKASGLRHKISTKLGKEEINSTTSASLNNNSVSSKADSSATTEKVKKVVIGEAATVGRAASKRVMPSTDSVLYVKPQQQRMIRELTSSHVLTVAKPNEVFKNHPALNSYTPATWSTLLPFGIKNLIVVEYAKENSEKLKGTEAQPIGAKFYHFIIDELFENAVWSPLSLGIHHSILELIRATKNEIQTKSGSEVNSSPELVVYKSLFSDVIIPKIMKIIEKDDAEVMKQKVKDADSCCAVAKNTFEAEVTRLEKAYNDFITDYNMLKATSNQKPILLQNMQKKGLPTNAGELAQHKNVLYTDVEQAEKIRDTLISAQKAEIHFVENLQTPILAALKQADLYVKSLTDLSEFSTARFAKILFG